MSLATVRLMGWVPQTPRRAAVLSTAASLTSFIRGIANDEFRAYGLGSLAPQLPEDERTKVLDEALSAVRAITGGPAPDYLRAPALTALAPELSEQQVDEALSLAQAINREAWRAPVLSALALRVNRFTVVPRHRVVRKLLRLISTGSRVSLEESWPALSELIAIEGPAECSATANSLIEVTNWRASTGNSRA